MIIHEDGKVILSHLLKYSRKIFHCQIRVEWWIFQHIIVSPLGVVEWISTWQNASFLHNNLG